MDTTLVEIVSAVPSVRPLGFWRTALAVAVGVWIAALPAVLLGVVLGASLFNS